MLLPPRGVYNTLSRTASLTPLSWSLLSQFYCSVTQLRPTPCDPMGWNMTGFPVLHHLLEFAQTHVHWVGDAIQPFHSLSSPSPPAFNLSQHQGLFQWIGSLHPVVKVLELQLQHQSCWWIFRLTSLTIDWFDLLAVQRTLNSPSQFNSMLKLSLFYCLTLLHSKRSQWGT